MSQLQWVKYKYNKLLAWAITSFVNKVTVTIQLECKVLIGLVLCTYKAQRADSFASSLIVT